MARSGADEGLPPLQYFKVYEPSPGVVHVEINRPDKLNAFIEPMWLELRTIFTHLSHSPSTLAIVLSGAGPRAFTSGLDTTAFSTDPNLQSSVANDDPARKSHRLRTHIDTFQSCITAVATCSKPVIAAIHGYCYGLGVDLSLCADVRICDAKARFSVKEVDIGIAADIGTLSRLPKVVGGGSWVKDICLSGRVFEAREALMQGFVSRVVGQTADADNTGKGAGREGVVKTAMDWAALVASKSPVAVQGTKEILNWSWDRSVSDGMRYTSVWNSAMLQSEDVKEATMAGISKRKARFAKL